ncbi:uncharacterized protein LACBIDRAFT_316485 [Laccaria bicolor S238N-H82]|uniref:Predicted protein n=1 Tax=Laccaria bicolor (strain S238N-H82 / ATCC MYA-4686) TaxID=486041 RepID=B0E122_LACBS|nr:uncharacterized protein LACBIDRAFT_316485 [Laccaria bicolor S238N-H82]EDQ99435.1 predicted protein [Laccaria bicolor S238N-H82]|eukprot:XP_001889890.1 predicted protein [Laccaria bicolor S238N-H82]
MIGCQYKPLLKEEMKANTAVADPNARGQSRAKPAWFWSSNLAGDMQDNERMVEFHRINWLRARARFHR